MHKGRLAAVLAAVLVIVGCATVGGVSQAATGQTIFGTGTSGINVDPDSSKTSVGTQFKVATAGTVDAIRVHRSPNVSGALTGKLTRGSTVLATVTLPAAGAGWQEVDLPAPVSVVTGKTYTVYYTATTGRYSVQSQYSWPKVSSDLTAVKGVYTFGSGVPTSVYQNENYWVDVVFNPTPVTPTTSVSPSPTTTAEPTTSDPTTPPVTTPPTTTEPTTTAPTTTTTPTPAGCVGAANTPGGPDPWGGCWPGPQNTGYPHGLPGDTRAPVTLTPYTGPYTIKSCGVVIDSKELAQDLLIEAGLPDKSLTGTPCVTIRNSLVHGVIFAESRDYGPVLVQDTEVVPDGMSWWENVGRSNYVAERVNSHGSLATIKCDDNCIARDNYVWGMRLAWQYHYDAIGGNGTSNFNVQHNWASCGDWSGVEPNTTGEAGCSSAIGFFGDFAANHDITLNRNFITSTPRDANPSDIDRQSAYCLNPGYYPNKPFPDTANITVTDNVFARGSTGKCGVYGPTNSLNGVGHPNGNVWSGNVFEDGVVINRVEE